MSASLGTRPATDVIALALRFPIEPVLKRYGKYFGVSEAESREHELELKRYLILCALNRHGGYAVKSPVDDLWHTFIIFTELYSEFCSRVAGRYIHHTPTEANTRSPEDRVQSYESMLADYESIFGEKPPVHIWPRSKEHGNEEASGSSYTPPCC